jgi:hypothetical protein
VIWVLLLLLLAFLIRELAHDARPARPFPSEARPYNPRRSPWRSCKSCGKVHS